MREIRFEWDEQKDHSNRLKHGVAFAEARSVFYDDGAIEYFDPEHSETEDRFIMIGLSAKARLLIVSYEQKALDHVDVIRIISSRKATKTEQKHYVEVNR